MQRLSEYNEQLRFSGMPRRVAAVFEKRGILGVEQIDDFGNVCVYGPLWWSQRMLALMKSVDAAVQVSTSQCVNWSQTDQMSSIVQVRRNFKDAGKKRGKRSSRQFNALWVDLEAESPPKHFPRDLIADSYLANLPSSIHDEMEMAVPLFEDDDVNWLFWPAAGYKETDYDDLDAFDYRFGPLCCRPEVASNNAARYSDTRMDVEQ